MVSGDDKVSIFILFYGTNFRSGRKMMQKQLEAVKTLFYTSWNTSPQWL